MHPTRTYSFLTNTFNPKWSQKVKTFFPESSHVAYQIKENGAYSTMQAHSMSLHTPSAPGWGQNSKKVVMLYIKIIGLGHRAPCKHIFCPYTLHRPLELGKNVQTFYLP